MHMWSHVDYAWYLWMIQRIFSPMSIIRGTDFEYLQGIQIIHFDWFFYIWLWIITYCSEKNICFIFFFLKEKYKVRFLWLVGLIQLPKVAEAKVIFRVFGPIQSVDISLRASYNYLINLWNLSGFTEPNHLDGMSLVAWFKSIATGFSLLPSKDGIEHWIDQLLKKS